MVDVSYCTEEQAHKNEIGLFCDRVSELKPEIMHGIENQLRRYEWTRGIVMPENQFQFF